jgi:glucose/arabinose dehydrogenase
MKKIIIIIFLTIILILTSFSTMATHLNNQKINKKINRVASAKNSFSSEIIIGNISTSLGKIVFEVINIGDEIATNINWNIVIKGGLLGLINLDTIGNINSISSGKKVLISSDFLFGFGDISIDITIGPIGKSLSGSIFFFFVKIKPDFTVKLDVLAEGFNSPLYATNAADGSNRLFVVDQMGLIYVIKDNELLSEPFLDITNKIVDLDVTYDERGLLGLAFHPDYKTNGRFFVYYSSPKTGAGINHESILAEYHISDNENKADPNSEIIIFRVDQPEANHNGGQLVFGPDGYLYLGLGDGGGAGDQHGTIGNGQNINTVLGSIIRIDIDNGNPYSIPSDNPFVDTDGLDEIYAYGLRNPWRFSFDKETNKLFVADVGQDKWEEINIMEKGGNYGWRILEGTHGYDLELADELGIDINILKEPIHEYSHSLGRSITGGFVYRGTENEKLIGKYIFGDWSSSFVIPRGSLYYLEEVKSGVWQRFDLVTSEIFNRFIMSFGEDENGELYVLSKTSLGPTGSSGDIRKIIIE